MTKQGNDQNAFISLRRLKDFWSSLQNWLPSHYVTREEYQSLLERIEALEQNN